MIYQPQFKALVGLKVTANAPFLGDDSAQTGEVECLDEHQIILRDDSGPSLWRIGLLWDEIESLVLS